MLRRKDWVDRGVLERKYESSLKEKDLGRFSFFGQLFVKYLLQEIRL